MPRRQQKPGALAGFCGEVGATLRSQCRGASGLLNMASRLGAVMALSNQASICARLADAMVSARPGCKGPKRLVAAARRLLCPLAVPFAGLEIGSHRLGIDGAWIGCYYSLFEKRLGVRSCIATSSIVNKAARSESLENMPLALTYKASAARFFEAKNCAMAGFCVRARRQTCDKCQGASGAANIKRARIESTID